MVNGVIVGRKIFTQQNLKFALIFAHSPFSLSLSWSHIILTNGHTPWLKLSSKFGPEISVITVTLSDRC